MEDWIHLVIESNDWRAYQEEIYDRFKAKFPDCEIEFDVKVQGRMSGVKRQVDVTIKGDVGGYRAFGAVECRSGSRRVDVTAIDGFRGFLEDIGADFGIMVAREGYSDAARERARHAHIKLDVLSFIDLAAYEFDWDVCGMCDPGPDRPPALIHVETEIPPAIEQLETVAEIFRCDWCNGISVRCAGCGTVTPAWEGDYGSPTECEGGCGMRFVVAIDYADDWPQEFVEILPLD